MLKKTEKINENSKTKKHHDVKKGIGRIIALILVLSMLFASSATLIFYIIINFSK